jgi:hypothetical protein
MTPADLGLVIRHSGKEIFLPAESVIEIAPALSFSTLPGAPGVGIAFWRGRAIEVRGIGAVAESFVLVRGRDLDFFLTSESRPVAVSRALSGAAEAYAEVL